ncbi:MAG: hypothetical protein JO041_08585, partial [Acidobacteria bacterium]|nr:hypothetical protein [Acidobacteriota bacterium]
SARIRVAMLGTREERMLLIRDCSRVVAMAVLNSPKLSETEMEGFAAMKNIQEDVMRGMARNRLFMRNYAVVRALVHNARTPIDVGLGLLHHLTAPDLQQVSRNKSVSDPVRRVATKVFRNKTERGG